MELRDDMHVLRRNRLIVVCMTPGEIGEATAYSLTRTPVYSSTSTVAVSRQTSSAVSGSREGSSFPQARLGTSAAVAWSSGALDPIIEELDLDMNSSELSTSRVKIRVVRSALPSTMSLGTHVPPNLRSEILLASPRTAEPTPKCESLEDVAQITDHSLMGILPVDSGAGGQPFTLEASPTNPGSDLFRALRASPRVTEIDGVSSFVTVLSVPCEGRQSRAASRAIALTVAGKGVALIARGLSKSNVAEYRVIEGSTGLADTLIGRTEFTDVVRFWGRRSLHVLPASRGPHQSERAPRINSDTASGRVGRELRLGSMRRARPTRREGRYGPLTFHRGCRRVEGSRGVLDALPAASPKSCSLRRSRKERLLAVRI